jgi:hypothetical protein
MKLSTHQLKQIIKEELRKVLLEGAESGEEGEIRSWERDELARPAGWTQEDEDRIRQVTSRPTSKKTIMCKDLYEDWRKLSLESHLHGPFPDGSYLDPTIVNKDGEPVGRTISSNKLDRKIDYILNIGKKTQCKWAFSDDEWDSVTDIKAAGDPAPKRDDI